MGVRDELDSLTTRLRRFIEDGSSSHVPSVLQSRIGVIARRLTARHLLDDGALAELAVEAQAVVAELRRIGHDPDRQ